MFSLCVFSVKELCIYRFHRTGEWVARSLRSVLFDSRGELSWELRMDSLRDSHSPGVFPQVCSSSSESCEGSCLLCPPFSPALLHTAAGTCHWSDLANTSLSSAPILETVVIDFHSFGVLKQPSLLFYFIFYLLSFYSQ